MVSHRPEPVFPKTRSHLLSIPCLLSPGLLRTDPGWSPLRDDPRFRKLAQLDG